MSELLVLTLMFLYVHMEDHFVSKWRYSSSCRIWSMPGDKSILIVEGSTCFGNILLLNEVCLYKIYLVWDKWNFAFTFQKVAWSLCIIVVWVIMVGFFFKSIRVKVFYKLMCWLGVLTCRLISVMRSPAVRRSCWPYYRSAGHRLFSLCITSHGRGWSNGLECDSKFVQCLKLVLWMTSCTAEIPRSLWIISLVTYCGALTIALNIFDWHLCMTVILDLQAQPHSSMPYVHIGVIMDLYSRSLLSTDRWDFLPSNQ
jgi:hypothetical protein